METIRIVGVEFYRIGAVQRAFECAGDRDGYELRRATQLASIFDTTRLV